MLRWRIGKSEPDVVQRLLPCKVNVNIYRDSFGGSGTVEREEIDRVEASLYRKILRIGNDIPNSAVLNIMTSTRLAGEVIHYLSKEAQDEYRR